VVYVCENNQYATEVPFGYATGGADVAARAAGYGIPGLQVDGNDVLAVYEAAGQAVRRARTGGGPTLIECLTYRLRPHCEGMQDFGYRTREEVEQWAACGPIVRFRQLLLSEAVATEADLASIDAEVKELTADAVRFAENSPLPDPATVTRHVYAEA
jgi:2-oxoisovalerate dehydrogenase E1 component